MKNILKIILILFITNGIAQKQVEVDGFVLAAPSPSVLTITEPEEYEGNLKIEIWEKEKWDKHLNDKTATYFARYTKQANDTINVDRTTTLEVSPGDYLLSVELKNKATGEWVVHQKILNTETGKPNEVHGDGFSIQFIPDRN